MAEPGFWDDQESARAVIDESNRLKGWVEPSKALADKGSELEALAELLEEEEEAELAGEFEQELAVLEKSVDCLLYTSPSPRDS